MLAFTLLATERYQKLLTSGLAGGGLMVVKELSAIDIQCCFRFKKQWN